MSEEEIESKFIILRERITSRGGGIEIDLSPFGYPGEKMSAYQNYLGGGILGRIQSDDTIRKSSPFVELEVCKELDKIAEVLKKKFHRLTNPDSEWESMSYEQNQKLPKSAY